MALYIFIQPFATTTKREEENLSALQTTKCKEWKKEKEKRNIFDAKKERKNRQQRSLNSVSQQRQHKRNIKQPTD